MAIECDPDVLAELAACYLGLSEAQLDGAAVYLACAWVNGTAQTCTPTALATESTCYTAGLDQQQKLASLVYLLCQQANA
jgi:hypothetical protein